MLNLSFSVGRKAQKWDLIYDGPRLTGRMDHHDPGIAPTARDAVQAVLDGALAQRGRAAKTALNHRRFLRITRPYAIGVAPD